MSPTVLDGDMSFALVPSFPAGIQSQIHCGMEEKRNVYSFRADWVIVLSLNDYFYWKVYVVNITQVKN